MVNLSKLTKKRLGEILVSEGLVTEDQVQEALRKQGETGDLLGATLVKLGYISEYDIAKTIVTQFGLPYLDCTHYKIPEDLIPLFPVERLLKDQMVPLDKIGRILVIAVSGLLDEAVFADVEKRTGCEIFLYVSTQSQVLQAIQTHYADGKPLRR